MKSTQSEEVRPRVQPSSVWGVLVVDAVGHVVAANTSARDLWRAQAKPLVNRPLVGLLGSDASESEGGFAAIQWELLRKVALDRALPVTVHPIDGSATRRMQLRLERAHGGGGSYIATIVG